MPLAHTIHTWGTAWINPWQARGNTEYFDADADDAINIVIDGRSFVASESQLVGKSRKVAKYLENAAAARKIRKYGIRFSGLDPALFSHVLRYIRYGILSDLVRADGSIDEASYDILRRQAKSLEMKDLEVEIEEKLGIEDPAWKAPTGAGAIRKH